MVVDVLTPLDQNLATTVNDGVFTRVGVDVQDVDEMAQSMSQYAERFLTRVFHEAEADFARRHPAGAARYLAGQFAAREAVLKVLGAQDAISMWRSILICNPGALSAVELSGEARHLALSLGITEIFLSVARSTNYAMAVAVADVNIPS